MGYEWRTTHPDELCKHHEGEDVRIDVKDKKAGYLQRKALFGQGQKLHSNSEW